MGCGSGLGIEGIRKEVARAPSNIAGGVKDTANAITDAVGLTDYEGQKAASATAKAQAEKSYNLTTDQIAFQKAQYEDWKSIYGPLQEDLGTYYKNLTGDSVAAQKLVAQQNAYQSAQKQIDTQLAQRGMADSGLAANLMAQNIMGNEQAKAGIRATTTQEAQQQKMGFLGLGLGQGTQMLGINANVSNVGATSAAGMSNTALSNATQLSSLNQSGMQDMFGTVLGGFKKGGVFNQ